MGTGHPALAVGARSIVALCAALVALSPGAAAAQCRADVECKGDRICVNGECRDPAPAARPQPPPPPPPDDAPVLPSPPPPPSSEGDTSAPLPPPPPPPPSSSSVGDTGAAPSAVRELPGWALGGAIMGFVSAGVVGALAAGSAATAGDLVPSLPLGATATLVFAITVPIVATAGGSARYGAGVPGSLALRIVGWILYGLTLANAVVAVALGVESQVPVPVIASLGGLGVLTEVLMAIDALVARGQAVDVVERNTRGQQAGVRIAPVIALSPSRLGGAAMSFGLAGSF